VAPEHCCDEVLDVMGKPRFEVYGRFVRRFRELTNAAGLKQYLVPYLISSHPGSTLKHAIELAVFLKKEKVHPQQVQDFYPTPGTISTCIWYTGLDPYTLKPVHVPKSEQERRAQRALLQYFKPENYDAVRAALRRGGREDLIGSGPNCLVPAEANRTAPGNRTQKKTGRPAKTSGRRKG